MKIDEIHKHTHAQSLTECQVTKVKVGIKRRTEETILGTELRAQLRWGCNKPTIARDTSQKCPPFLS